jgi:hypothetical protein
LRTRLKVLAVVAVAGVATAIALSTTFPSPFSSAERPSTTAFIVIGQSSCTAHQSNFNCTLVLSRSAGTIGTNDISSVKINGTAAQISGMTATEDSVSVNAGIKIVSIIGGLNDVNNVPPVTVGQVTVYLRDGTTVSATLPGQYAE